jgi:uncharacterized membrane protein
MGKNIVNIFMTIIIFMLGIFLGMLISYKFNKHSVYNTPFEMEINDSTDVIIHSFIEYKGFYLIKK